MLDHAIVNSARGCNIITYGNNNVNRVLEFIVIELSLFMIWQTRHDPYNVNCGAVVCMPNCPL